MRTSPFTSKAISYVWLENFYEKPLHNQWFWLWLTKTTVSIHIQNVSGTAGIASGGSREKEGNRMKCKDGNERESKKEIGTDREKCVSHDEKYENDLWNDLNSVILKFLKGN